MRGADRILLLRGQPPRQLGSRLFGYDQAENRPAEGGCFCRSQPLFARDLPDDEPVSRSGYRREFSRDSSRQPQRCTGEAQALNYSTQAGPNRDKGGEEDRAGAPAALLPARERDPLSRPLGYLQEREGPLDHGASHAHHVGMLLWDRTSTAGWTALGAFAGMLGSVQHLALGILGEHAGKTLEQVKGRPLYIVRGQAGFLSSRSGDKVIPAPHFPLQRDAISESRTSKRPRGEATR